jgi:hypothetical protein
MRTGRGIEPATVDYYPTGTGDGVSFPVRSDLAPHMTIQTRRGDPRFIEDEDDET